MADTVTHGSGMTVEVRDRSGRVLFTGTPGGAPEYVAIVTDDAGRPRLVCDVTGTSADGRTGPKAPAPGRNERWELMGEVGVDGASMAIVELAGRSAARAPSPGDRRYVQFSDVALNTGVNFWAGFGDGSYEAWAWIVEYGTEDRPDERVAQVAVTLIDDHELEEWNRSSGVYS